MHLKNNNLSVIRTCINEILPGFFFLFILAILLILLGCVWRVWSSWTSRGIRIGGKDWWFISFVYVRSSHNIHIFHSFHGYDEFNELGCSQRMGLHSSVGLSAEALTQRPWVRIPLKPRKHFSGSFAIA